MSTETARPAGLARFRQRTARRPAFLRPVLVVLGGLGLLSLLDYVSGQVVGGNSDGATVVLEGKALSDGNLLLRGWEISLDSFWTIDASLNALVVRVIGLRPLVLHFVPALIATLVVLLGIFLSRGASPRASIVGGLTVVGLLALPSRAFAVFLLQGPLHVGTALWCLIALALLAPTSAKSPPAYARTRWALAVLFLVAGLLGDLQMFALGVVPIAGAAALAMARARNWRAGWTPLSASLASLALALVVHLLARAAGGFTRGATNALADRAEVLSNLSHLPSYSATLFGTENGFAPTGMPLVLRDLHWMGLGLVLASACWALLGLLGGAGTGRQFSVLARDGAFVDDTLLLATFGSLVTYLYLPTTTSPAFSRYLTAACICSSILAGRNLGRLAARLRPASGRVVLVATLAVVLAFGVGLGLSLREPRAPQPAQQLASFLLAHDLREGVGDYWSASLVTLESSGAVQVRPVVATIYGRLVRYAKQSADDWYRGQRFNFVVFDPSAPFGAVDLATASQSFGQPTQRYDVGPYTVLVFPHRFGIALKGALGGA